MNLLILNASPKKKGGASRFFSRLFRLFLPGVRKKAVSLSSRQDFQQVLELFPDMDAVCLFVPLYVDGLPSHVVEFLIQAEEILQKPSLPVPVVCAFQQRLCRGKTKPPRPAYASGVVRKGRNHLGRRNRNRRRGDAPGTGDRLPHPDWNHSASNGVILFSAPVLFQADCGVPLPSRYSHGFFSTAACYSVWHVFRRRFAGSKH